MRGPTAPDTPVRSVTTSDIRLVFLGVNPRKMMGPDGVPGRALGSCVDQLAEVFTHIFYLSLLQIEVPTCFTKTTIIPVAKKAHAVCLNDYHPIALPSIIMKGFERLVMAHINSSLPTCINPLQFAYRHAIYKFTEDTTVVGRIYNNNESNYRREMEGLMTWCNGNNLFLNKTKELITDFRKKGGEHAPIYINGIEVERVESVKFLRVMAAQEIGMSTRTLTNFYRCTIENIQSGCITAWYGNCSVQEHKKPEG
eukprot:g36526.t1